MYFLLSVLCHSSDPSSLIRALVIALVGIMWLDGELTAEYARKHQASFVSSLHGFVGSSWVAVRHHLKQPDSELESHSESQRLAVDVTQRSISLLISGEFQYDRFKREPRSPDPQTG